MYKKFCMLTEGKDKKGTRDLRQTGRKRKEASFIDGRYRRAIGN